MNGPNNQGLCSAILRELPYTWGALQFLCKSDTYYYATVTFNIPNVGQK